MRSYRDVVFFFRGKKYGYGRIWRGWVGVGCGDCGVEPPVRQVSLVVPSACSGRRGASGSRLSPVVRGLPSRAHVLPASNAPIPTRTPVTTQIFNVKWKTIVGWFVCVYIQEAKPDLCDRSDCKVLSFFCAIVFEGICKLSWFEVFSGARISATAKASKSTVGWTPTSPLLRWAKSEPLPMQM